MQPRQFFHFQSIQCETIDAISSNKLQYNASPVERVAVSRDYRSVDYPDIGFAHFPLVRPLIHMYVYQNIWKKNSLTTDSPFSISRQRPTGTVESAKQIKRKGSFYRSYGFTWPPASTNLSFSCPATFSLPFSLILFLSLFKTGRTCSRPVAAERVKRGSDKGLSLWVTIQRRVRERERQRK